MLILPPLRFICFTQPAIINHQCSTGRFTLMADQNRPVTGYPAAGHDSIGYPATAYPYVAPPQPQNQTTYFNVAWNRNYSDPYALQQRATFVHRIFSILAGAAIITGTGIFILWLILRPQIPQFTIDTLTLSNFSISPNSLVSGKWDAHFTVRNPNSKITIYYDQIEAAVFYKSDSISETTVPPFVQGIKNETTIRATFASLSAYIDDHGGMNGERNNGSVSFNLRMVARVKIRARSWWARERILRVYCPDLSVRVSSNSTGGSLIGDSKQCRVAV